MHLDDRHHQARNEFLALAGLRVQLPLCYGIQRKFPHVSRDLVAGLISGTLRL